MVSKITGFGGHKKNREKQPRLISLYHHEPECSPDSCVVALIAQKIVMHSRRPCQSVCLSVSMFPANQDLPFSHTPFVVHG